jgi:hypothetical protein
MDTSTKEKKAAIMMMMHGFPSSQSGITGDTVSAYLLAVESIDAEAVKRACARFLGGRVPGHNNAFLPTAGEIAAEAMKLDHRADLVSLHNGLLEMDFGHGRIDMRGLTEPEQDRIIELGGKTPDGRNFALLSLAEKRAALDPKALPAPNRVPVPRIQRMNK